MPQTKLQPMVVEPPSEEAWEFARRVTEIHASSLGWREKEAAVIPMMLDRIFQPRQEGDLLCGRVCYPLAGISPEPAGFGWYGRCEDLPPDLAEYWRANSTSASIRAQMPDWVREALPSDRWAEELLKAAPLYRLAGVQLDYPRLMAEGVPAQVQDFLEPVFARYGLTHLLVGPPASFRDGVQLFWLYALATGTWNYGRLDVALGPLLQKDLGSGEITESEALDLLRSLWRLMAAFDNQYNNRVIVGGRGRPDEKAGDIFAHLAIEATRLETLNQPQLSLRFYKGQDPSLYARAMDCLAEGRTFPILYNDDVNIPGVTKAFEISEEEAAQYLPYGCGEYMIWPKTFSSPNGIINLPACLLAGGDWDGYDREVTLHMRALAAFQKLEYEVAFSQCEFPLIRALYDPEPRLTAAVETYGNTNVADSFCRMEHGEAGGRFGNDCDTADAWAIRVHEHACTRAIEAGKEFGIHQVVVVVNNWANVLLGRFTPATPDGRKDGEAFANGNNPTPGADVNGVTAFMLSLAKLRSDCHACTVQNMKFSKGAFRQREKMESLLDVYWQKGGAQAMITVVGKEDLEQAMAEPEKWGHLMVRVGGFSARFIDLPRDVQLEILTRTLHE